MDELNEKIHEAYVSSILTSDDEVEMGDKVDEASQIPFGELSPEKQKLIQNVLKGTTYDINKQTVFSGIHGEIVDFQDQFGTGNIRLDKKAVQKILKDKNVRWIEVKAVGF